MIADADAEAPRDPPHHNSDAERRPAEIEYGQSRAGVERKHEKSDRPVDRFFMGIDRYFVSHFSSSWEFTVGVASGLADFFGSSATRTFCASPNRFIAQMPYQWMSISYQVRPWRAEAG